MLALQLSSEDDRLLWLAVTAIPDCAFDAGSRWISRRASPSNSQAPISASRLARAAPCRGRSDVRDTAYLFGEWCNRHVRDQPPPKLSVLVTASDPTPPHRRGRREQEGQR